MVILDVAIVNVALPSIKSDLDFSQANLQWVISAYAIIFGGTLLLGGRLGDLLGRLGRLLAELAPVRSRVVRELAHRIPRSAGARWSPAGSGRARAAHDDV